MVLTKAGNKHSFRFSQKKVLNLENVKEEHFKAGVYKLYSKISKNPIYIGVSHKVAHRLQAHLYGRSDYQQVSGKKELLKESYYYAVHYCSIEKAREYEHKNKRKCKYNKY